MIPSYFNQSYMTAISDQFATPKLEAGAHIRKLKMAEALGAIKSSTIFALDLSNLSGLCHWLTGVNYLLTDNLTN